MTTKTLSEMIKSYGVTKAALQVAHAKKDRQGVVLWGEMLIGAVEAIEALGFDLKEDLQIVKDLVTINREIVREAEAA